MSLHFIRQFLRLEAASGIVLFLATLMALTMSQLFAEGYSFFFHESFHIEKLGTIKPFSFWINEGLMTLFFLLVGIELKREFLEGEFKELSKIMLPACAAFGGMIVPALIYVSINQTYPALKGWAIPVATDIAFALGVLSLLGKRVPLGLKLFLMALAIFDDLGAILIIAFFYGSNLSYFFLSLVFLYVIFLSFFSITNRGIFYLLGFFLWFLILKSGVHPTLAGVILAFLLPRGWMGSAEKKLHPWVAFGIMPLFALANMGLNIKGHSWTILLEPVSLGIILGLVLGKPLGVLMLTELGLRVGGASLPQGVKRHHLLGVAALCGIGFTMSLFLGTLAFQHENAIYLTTVRLSVLTGSLCSGLIGFGMLVYVFKKRENPHANK